MRIERGLAILGVSLAFGGLGFEVTQHRRGSDASAAITALYCNKTYGDSSGNITAQTVDCMEEGWVPEGKSVPSGDFEKGWPVGLLNGYIALEQSKARHFNPAFTVEQLIWGAGIGFLGTMGGKSSPGGGGGEGGGGGRDDGPEGGGTEIEPVDEDGHEYQLGDV